MTVRTATQTVPAISIGKVRDQLTVDSHEYLRFARFQLRQLVAGKLEPSWTPSARGISAPDPAQDADPDRALYCDQVNSTSQNGFRERNAASRD